MGRSEAYCQQLPLEYLCKSILLNIDIINDTTYIIFIKNEHLYENVFRPKLLRKHIINQFNNKC